MTDLAVGSLRPDWTALPAWLRGRIEELAGSPVVQATNQAGGFSPGLAARLRLADGSRAFAKAVSGAVNPDSPAMHRAEARIAAALPTGVPAPRLRGSVDEQGWVALVFDEVPGRMPVQPWQPAELDRVLAALTELAGALTPSPIAEPTVPTASAVFEADFRGWRTLAGARDRSSLAGVDDWARQHLDQLAELEARAPDALAGSSLVHGDVRADNLLISEDAVHFVDWPWACLAQPWLDLVGLLPSVALQGGPSPWQLFDEHPLGRAADPGAVDAAVAAVAGFLVEHAGRPAPPGLPTVRAFQRAQGVVAVRWLCHRLGCSSPGDR